LEFEEVVRRRRMVRAFEPRPVPPEVLDRILTAAASAPSAGNSQGTDLVVLEGPDQTARYWDVTLPAEHRPAFRWPGLLTAPVLVIPVANPGAYLERYSEPDKAASGLGEAEDRWPVPYWQIDTAFAAMLALLAAVDESLGALFFGIFFHEAELVQALGVPEGHRPIGTIALGYAAGGDRPSASLRRGRRPFDEIVHRSGW
jgi:nitroreductase